MKKITVLLTAIMIIATLSYGWIQSTSSGGAGLKWATSNTTYYINELGYSQTTNEFDAIHGAFQAWNDVPTASCYASFGGTTSSNAITPNDSMNNVVFIEPSFTGDTSGLDLGSTTLAICVFAFYNDGTIVDADIYVNAVEHTWATDGSSSLYDIQNVMTHEIGHYWGLSDIYDDSYSESTMYGYASPGETSSRTLHQDDIDGISALYPDSSATPTPTPTATTTPTPTPGSTSDDHGNTISTATTFTIGSTQTGNLETGGDIDMFSFSATAGATYTISVNLYSLSDSYLELYDSSSTSPIAYNDDKNSSTYASELIWTCSTSGTYYVAVKGYSSSETGSYSLDITTDSQTTPTPTPTPTTTPTPTPDIYNVSISSDSTSYTVGNTVAISATVGGSGSADVYIAVVWPDGFFSCLKLDGTFGDYNQAVSLVDNWQVIAGEYSVLSYQTNSAWPTGTYSWYLIFVNPGTNALDTSNWISYDSSTHTLN